MGRKLYKLTSLLSVTAIVGVGSTFFIPNLYARLGLTDFDQRWNTVPNNGDYYCLPTSFLNAMTYMHTHGVPEVPDLDNLPIDQRITVLGVLFGTDPQTGTSGGLAHTYMQGWLSNSSNPLVFSFKYGSNTDWGTYRIRQAISSGSIVILAYGRYEKLFPNADFYARTGGHVVTAKGYDAFPANDILFLRDPARDDNNSTVQGPFRDFATTMRNKTFRRVPGGSFVTHAEYALDISTSSKFRAVDGMYQYLPAGGGWSNSQVLQDGFQDSSGRAKKGPERIFVRVPFQYSPEPGEEPLPTEYEITPREEVVDWVFDLGSLSVFYVTKLGRVFEVDLTDDRHHRLIHVIKGAKRLMVGGQNMDVFVLGDGSVKPGDGSVRIYRLDRENNSMSSIMLPFEASSMEYDPRTDGPAVFSDSLDKLVSVDYDLANRIEHPISDMPAGSGKPFFRINPENGDVLYGRQGGNGIQIDRRDGTGRSFFLNLTSVGNLKTVVPVRENLMIVQDGDQLQTMDGFGNRASSQFDGITNVVGTFKMNRSADFGKANLDFGQGWQNIPPSQLDN